MNKINRFFTAAIAFALLTGCGNKGTTDPAMLESTTESTTTYESSSIDRTSAQAVADGFINAIEN